MKKIGILILTIVLALGSLGVGYAMWYDTVHVDVQVDTGCVDLQITSVSGTWVYKDLDDSSIVYSDVALTAAQMTAGNLIYVASAKGVNASQNDGTWLDEWARFYFDNLFPTPGHNLVADVLFTYPCTIPAHVIWTNVIEPYSPVNDDCAALAALVTYKWTVKTAAGVLVGEYTNAQISSIQLHQGYTLKLEAYIDAATLQAHPELESLDCWVRCSNFNVYQWNETW